MSKGLISMLLDLVATCMSLTESIQDPYLGS